MFVRGEQPEIFLRDTLAALLNTCLILYTESSIENIDICSRGRGLPAGGIFLPVVPQGDSLQEAIIVIVRITRRRCRSAELREAGGKASPRQGSRWQRGCITFPYTPPLRSIEILMTPSTVPEAWGNKYQTEDIYTDVISSLLCISISTASSVAKKPAVEHDSPILDLFIPVEPGQPHNRGYYIRG